ncbi:OsmC family protein [Domibacillus indicus]|uniref:OsmC family protein n=1 Tax=Domibacillus indicus TaxID=1437523 RepID=UPI000617B91C|nr:hypothetical protein [Domibacillus indicus]
MEPVYSVTVNAQGGREGKVWTEEGPLNLELTTPAVLGGKGQLRTSYLELFGASIAACYQNAIQQAAGIDDHDNPDEVFADVAAQVDVLKDPERGGHRLSVVLHVKFYGGRFNELLDLRVIDEASGFCPLIKALEGECDFAIRRY